jgi:predicted nucleotidyltransferase
MLLKEWRKFKGWAVLEYFLSGGDRTYLKELSRILSISPRTAQTYLQLYEKEGLLEKEKSGNAIFYSLATNATTKELKKTYLLLKISPSIHRFLSENPQLSNITLYGSAARGEQDRSSDIDLLVISSSKRMNLSGMSQLERELGLEVKLEILTIGEWRKLAEKKDKFYSSITKNNILLYGALP